MFADSKGESKEKRKSRAKGKSSKSSKSASLNTSPHTNYSQSLSLSIPLTSSPRSFDFHLPVTAPSLSLETSPHTQNHNNHNHTHTQDHSKPIPSSSPDTNSRYIPSSSSSGLSDSDYLDSLSDEERNMFSNKSNDGTANNNNNNPIVHNESILTDALKQFEGISDDQISTHSSREQISIQSKVGSIYNKWAVNQPETITLFKDAHINYLINSLNGLSEGFSSLDASRPWIVYWVVQSLSLLNYSMPSSLGIRILNWLNQCQNSSGGFGGGPSQAAHLAPTYAATCTVALLLSVKGCEEQAKNLINRKTMYQFLMKMKHQCGGFHVQADGEVDTRGVYCTLAVASMLNIMTPELISGTAEWIQACQTHEGGIGGEPGTEAHGGYAFCGLASLIILKQTHLIQIDRLIRWGVQRQMSLEGGFQGRTNKLVDGCYSFWMGALFPLLDYMYNQTHDKPNSNSNSSTSNNSSTSTSIPSLGNGDWLFNQVQLQKYILVACQAPSGGLRDKPGKHPDQYHTCYCLSGLSICQNSSSSSSEGSLPLSKGEAQGEGAELKASRVLGNPQNLLRPTNPIYNVETTSLSNALAYFQSLPSPSSFDFTPAQKSEMEFKNLSKVGTATKR